MARYSREQHDRAVDLYIKYKHSAADVIHELGYPSKGALLSWYADRLEEERTGVPSMRGERYRRYTDEQKQAAVDHYLGHGRRLKRTMRALGYPKSYELLTAWIDELAPGQRKLRHGPVPEELKRKAIVFLQVGVHSMGTIFRQHRRLVSSGNCAVGTRRPFFLGCLVMRACSLR